MLCLTKEGEASYVKFSSLKIGYYLVLIRQATKVIAEACVVYLMFKIGN